MPAGVAAARKFQLLLKRFHAMEAMAAGPAITDRTKAAPEPCRAQCLSMTYVHPSKWPGQ